MANVIATAAHAAAVKALDSAMIAYRCRLITADQYYAAWEAAKVAEEALNAR